MKVILQKDVPGLGDAGEVKTVKDGYARNFLLPRKMGVAAKDGSTKALEHQKRLMQTKSEKRNKEMAVVADKLKALGTLSVSVRVGSKNKLFGSVTPQSVANSLKELGYVIDKRKIEFSESIRTIGTFKIKVKLADKISVPLSLEVLADKSSKVEEEDDTLSIPAAKETVASAPAEKTE